MVCIFCLLEKEPSDEHVIPDSIGGRIHIHEVCADCNSHLSRTADGPFASCPLIELARYVHSIGGKRNIVPFPFGGVGTIEDGQKVSLNQEFVPHVKRALSIEKLAGGGLKVHFSADAIDRDDFDRMLGKPLRKALAEEFPDWPEDKLTQEVNKVVAAAAAQESTQEKKPILKQWTIGLDDLLFEFLKIAYECWYRRFGLAWVQRSASAKMLRTALLNRDPSLAIQGQLFCAPPTLPLSDPSRNHLILLATGTCLIRLFTLTCAVQCEECDPEFLLEQEDATVIIQDFVDGSVIERRLIDLIR